LIAAVDSNGKVCLWDVKSHQLLSRAETTFQGPTSITFSPSCTQLILSRTDGSVLRWDITDKTLKAVGISAPPFSFLPRNDNTLFFDMKKGWQHGSYQPDALHWFPFEDPDAGLWVYVDGKIIRSNGGGSITIFDVGADSGNEG
jgi:WD40 repeat protein